MSINYTKQSEYVMEDFVINLISVDIHTICPFMKVLQ